MVNYAAKQLKNSPSPKRRLTDDWPRGSKQEASGNQAATRAALAAQDRAQQRKEAELRAIKQRNATAFRDFVNRPKKK
jgi:hypothetical protein